MNTETARDRIASAVMQWPGVEAGTGDRGEFGFRYRGVELGHLHGDRVAHFGFPRELGAALRESGRVGPHPVAPDSVKLAARRIDTEIDERDVVALMRLNYERVAARQGESATRHGASGERDGRSVGDAAERPAGRPGGREAVGGRARRTVLVTGATGNVGGPLVRMLEQAGHTVRALVRDPGRADLSSTVRVFQGDMGRPDTLEPALQGVDAVFLLWPFPTADGAEAVVERMARYARRIVYLSSMNVRDDRAPTANGFWGEIEALIERSGVPWVFLRAGGFMTNTLAWVDEIRKSGVVRWPFGDAARSLIHEADIAAVASRALTEDSHLGARYVLTGPETITQVEQVRILGEAMGRPARWEEIPVEQARQWLLDEWGDPHFVDEALRYWASLVETPEPVTRTVEEVTGSPARSFRQWAGEHAERFRATLDEVTNA